jgi:hypothetical protein
MIVGQLGPAQAHAQASGHGVGGQVVDQRAEARARVVLAGVDQLADVGPGDRGQVGQHGREPGAEGGRVEAVLEDRAIDDLEVEVEPGEATGDVDQDQIGIGQDAGVGQAGPQRAELAPHARMPQRQMILAVAVHAADRLDLTRVDDPGRRPVEPRQPQPQPVAPAGGSLLDPGCEVQTGGAAEGVGAQLALGRLELTPRQVEDAGVDPRVRPGLVAVEPGVLADPDAGRQRPVVTGDDLDRDRGRRTGGRRARAGDDQRGGDDPANHGRTLPVSRARRRGRGEPDPLPAKDPRPAVRSYARRDPCGFPRPSSSSAAPSSS